ncbi:MAG: hypothetical protein RLY66_246 [Candidatus Parcubacteria bacterium]|jgi:hypothetical protein
MTQSHALDILKTGKNAFITGPAGSGKTYVVNAYIKYLKEHGVPIGVTASTGIAATHMGGVTIHSWAGIGIKDSLGIHDLQEISERAQVRRKIEEAQVLIIDEVSMLHHFRLDLVDQVLRHMKKTEKPFGGIQIVLCGDFFQLPPVSRLGEPTARFIYESDSWKQGNFSICYLSENYRQGTDESVNILNDIRSGEVSERSYELLKSRHVTPRDGSFVSEENVVTLSEESLGVEPTRLYTHNVDVDTINEREIGRISGTECVYEMITKGKKPLVETLKKSCLAPDKLRLKKGARVMCVKNNFEEGYVNGTLGVIVSCGWGIDPVIRTAATPDYPDGREVAIKIADWTIEDDGRIIAQISQYPLRLAWAITVHKSQGMSLDAVEVDLSKSFEPGMGYVALSRVRTLAGLSILGMNQHALKVHPDVLEHDARLRELSAKAESVVEYTDVAEIKHAHDQFLARVAPMHRMGKKTRRDKDGVIKPQKVSTLEITAELIKKGKSLKEIAEARDMVPDTIIAHLEKLIELGSDQRGLEQSDIAYLKDGIARPHFMKIEKALQEVFDKQSDEKPPLLSPVKARIKGMSSFRDIQLARVLLGYFKKKGTQE